MAELHTEHSEKHTEGCRMTSVAEASFLLRQIAEPSPVGDSVKAAITRSARAVSEFLRADPRGKLTYGRAEDIWREEARRIDAAEMDAIRAAADKARREREDRARSAELREAVLLAARLERLAAELGKANCAAGNEEVRSTEQQARRTARALRAMAGAAQ